MSQTDLLAFGVAYVVIFGGLTAWLATTKGRGGCAWFVLGALIGPLALLAVALAPATQKPSPAFRAQAAPPPVGLRPETKRCPQCAETVKADARICRFCRYEFAPLPTGTAPGSTTAPQDTQPADASSEIPDSSVPLSRVHVAAEMERVTHQWTLPQLLIRFDDSIAGQLDMAHATVVLREHGYMPGSLVDDEQGQKVVTFALRPASADGAGQPRR